MEPPPTDKTVVVCDLSRYSDIVKDLDQHFGAGGVDMLNAQIRDLVRKALAESSAAASEPPPFKLTGDGAILILDTPDAAHRFAEALHRVAADHNRGKDVDLAQRHFRIGITWGPVVLNRLTDLELQLFDFAGAAIAKAVRLETACVTGQVLVDTDTHSRLPDLLRGDYGPVEVVHGKRAERYPAHRRVVAAPAPWDGPNARRRHVVRLGDRPRGFLQVLLPDFRVVRGKGGGVTLHVTVTDDHESIIDASGKAEFRGSLAAHPGAMEQLRSELDKFHRGNSAMQRFECPHWRLRYANGGALPIVRRDGRDYFCLFYRDIHPTGWNIANGGSDSVQELLNPLRIVAREFSEEVLAFDPDREVVYTFELDPAQTPAGVHDRTVRAWARHLDWDIDRYGRERLPVEEVRGPDTLCATVNGIRHTSDGVFVSVTPEDNAIEIDRVVRIGLPEGACLLDGEVFEDCAIARIVGLFEVDRLLRQLDAAADDDRFVPDRFFYMGREIEADGFDEAAATYCQMMRRRSELAAAYTGGDEPTFGLCPITRAVIGRYARALR